jgi:hypothetical protein
MLRDVLSSSTITLAVMLTETVPIEEAEPLKDDRMVKEAGRPISRTGALSVTVTVIEAEPPVGISQLARQLSLYK